MRLTAIIHWISVSCRFWKRLALVAGVALWSSYCAAAQDTAASACKAYFTTFVMDADLEVGLIPAMTADQAKWFKKKGQKKYPDLCQDLEKATYAIVTVQWREEKQRTVSRTHSARTTGPVTEIVGLSASGPGQPAQPIWGTQLRTFITTWRERETETVHQPNAMVLIFETKDGKALGAGGEIKPEPVGTSRGARAVGRNASKDALEWTLDVISLVTRAHHN
jgi:hypothetical protein